jgi:hypothetical protein
VNVENDQWREHEIFGRAGMKRVGNWKYRPLVKQPFSIPLVVLVTAGCPNHPRSDGKTLNRLRLHSWFQ